MAANARDIRNADGLTLAEIKTVSDQTAPKGLSVDSQKGIFSKPDKATILAELNKHDVYVRAYMMEADGKLTYLPASLSVKGKKIVVQQDYLNFKDATHDGKTNKVGIVLRVQAELVTTKSDLNLNGLFAIGLAVKAGTAAGVLRIQVYGLSGEPISALIPMPSDLNETSLQNALQSVASLKAKLYDEKVNIVPVLID